MRSGDEGGGEGIQVEPQGLGTESPENSVLCIWRTGTVPRGSQGWRWGAGLDPFPPTTWGLKCPGLGSSQ